MNAERCRILPVLLAGLVMAGCDGAGSPSAAGGGSEEPPTQQRTAAQCVRTHPLLAVGAGRDAPGRLEIDVNAGPQPEGPCANSSAFRFGSGLQDITGPVANTGGMGWESPTQVFSGLHTRQYARAFAIESPCNGRRVMFVSTDTGMIFGAVRQRVLAEIAADPALAAAYGPANLMLSATHTHQGPAGYSHYEAFNLFHFGFDELVLDTIVAGVVEAIRRAHANLEAHPQAAPVRLAVDELLDTNIQRSLPAFLMNTPEERAEFVDTRGEDVEVDKRFVQLSFVRDGGSAVGVINWFGVHPTILGPELDLVGSDHKGYAALGYERIMQTDYGDTAGADSFVAAFAQTDEGDASPNLFIVERPHPDPTRGGGRDPYESNAIAGTKQLAKALELFDAGEPLSGPVDYRLFHVRMDQVTVDDPAILAGLRHPAPLDAQSKRTCLAALGVSFGAGAEDGPGFTVEGVDCGDSPALVAAAAADFLALAGAKLPPNLLATTALCKLDDLPLLDLSCQAEKPVLFAVGPPLNAEPSVLPIQILRIGNLALLGLPWEVTTVAARRLRKTLLEVLAPVGIDTVVIAGLANDYVHYLTTREEYASQQYEGASNIFGPWTLAAVQQESRRLALSLRDGQPAPAGPAYVDATPILRRLPYLPSDLPGLVHPFGDVVADAPSSTAPGDTVRAEFQAGHPRNDLRIGSSYAYAERLNADGSWTVVASDRDPELLYRWHPLLPSPLPVELPEVGASTAELIWTLPRNLEAGTYRLRAQGVAQRLLLPAEPYSGVSRSFSVSAPISDCP